MDRRAGASPRSPPGRSRSTGAASATPRSIAATCADYRAAATIDLRHDEADLDRRVTCPLLALWGADARIGARFDVLGEWRTRAADVRGRPVSGGHFLVEESPGEMLAEIAAFLDGETATPG